MVAASIFVLVTAAAICLFVRSALDEVDCGREEEKEVHKVEEIGGEKGKKRR